MDKEYQGWSVNGVAAECNGLRKFWRVTGDGNGGEKGRKKGSGGRWYSGWRQG